VVSEVEISVDFNATWREGVAGFTAFRIRSSKALTLMAADPLVP
jgi:hypothetical protein